jgi:hypothetical protein
MQHHDRSTNRIKQRTALHYSNIPQDGQTRSGTVLLIRENHDTLSSSPSSMNVSSVSLKQQTGRTYDNMVRRQHQWFESRVIDNS